MNEAATTEFGHATTIDVLANDDAPGITLVSTSSEYASVAADGHSLVVNPVLGQARSYSIDYVARDARGCDGTGTLTVDVEYPTQVLVDGAHGGDSFDPDTSGDGRYIAFTSADDGLVAGDTNGAADVFVLDTQTQLVERISVAGDGTQANGASGEPAITTDGRYVAFASRATNLSADDANAVDDIYVHDRMTGTTTLVSRSLTGAGSDLPSLSPAIADDGTRIAFVSTADNLVVTDTNGARDVFLADLAASTLTRLSRTASGGQAPEASGPDVRLSGDGQYAAFTSTSVLDGSNRIGTFVVHVAAPGTVAWLGNQSGAVDLDHTGRHVAFEQGQVVVLDRTIGVANTVSTGKYPSLAADGRYTVMADSTASTGAIHVWNGSQVQEALRARTGMAVTPNVLRRAVISRDGRWIDFATSGWAGAVGRYVIVRVWNPAYQP